MLRKIRKQKQKHLLKLLCLSAAMLTATIAPQALAADITIGNDDTISTDVTSPCYAKNYKDGYYTAKLTGNITILTTPGSYALCAEGIPISGINSLQELDVNSDGSKTVKITGDIVAKSIETYNTTTKFKYGDGTVSLTLNNTASYLAGSLKLDSKNNRATIKLNLKNGATWYIPESDNTYYANPDYGAFGIYLNLDGGVVDLYHTTPTSKRTLAAGTRKLILNKTYGSTKNATFVLSSDIAGNRADSVYLLANTGNNTYYIQVAYDTSEGTDGTYKAKGDGIEILRTMNTGNTVTAKSYTTTKDFAAGLLTKTLKLTPTITTAAGVTKLTSVKVETVTPTTNTTTSTDTTTTTNTTPAADTTTTTPAGTTAGPAQIMAERASTTTKGAMSAWRAENNDLLRRMGELRDDEGKAGAWGRFYGGETEIAGSSTINYHGLQMGYDRTAALQSGKLFTGLALSHMEGDSSYNSGSGDTKSTMFGVYGSYLGKKGHFADLIIKYGRLENSTGTASSGVSYTGDNAANGLNMSLEYGYHQNLKNSWYLEPQAELNYGHINSSSYTMKMNSASGAHVANDAIDSVIGRIGVNIGKNIQNGNVYAKLSLVHEFAGDVGTTTSYGSYANHTSTSMQETWLEYGVGFNAKVNKDTNLYGEVSKSNGDKVTEKWKANLGIRHSF